MALQKKNFTEIPSDAVILTEKEAIKYQTKILNNWKTTSDVFAFKYGSGLLAGATIFAGVYMNNYFRVKFKLLHYGRVASYLPVCVVPAMLTVLLHQELVLKQLVLLKQEQCPICLELRASAIQSGLGCVLPLFLAPVSSMALVSKYETFNLPFITRQPTEVYNLLKKQIKPIKNILFGIFVGQALLGSVVTYFEAGSIYKVNFKLNQLEKQLENAVES